MIENAEYWKNRPLDTDRKDWAYEGNWIEGYVQSAEHPHRRLIVDALKNLEPSSVLEVGCNAGPNLLRIKELYPNAYLAGIDVNKDSIKVAKSVLPKATLSVGDVTHIPFPEKSFDVVLADAVLMYVEDIGKALEEMDRVSRKAIIILDWFDEQETIKDFHHARNYPELLEKLGYTVQRYKLTEEDWPRPIWVKNGWLFVAWR